jgi:hypothetical protein
MMIRSNLYEVAFEAFLKARKISYVAVDEARRTQFGDTSFKSLDFIIVGPDDARLVVDVKGRRFPGGTKQKPIKTWQNWAETEDVRGLVHWSAHLGTGFRGLLVFVYHIQQGFALPKETPDQYIHKDETYLMRAVDILEYRQYMKPRSSKWETVFIPVKDFRKIVKPFSDFLVEKKED